MNSFIKKNFDADFVFFLSDLIGNQVRLNNKKIGKLDDLIIVEQEKLPEVTYIIVNRPFGHKSLMIPVNRVSSFSRDVVIVDIESIKGYEGEPEENQVLLKDHILDKKVIDLDDNDIDIVYDVKLLLRGRRMYVTDVDFSRYGMIKRIGLSYVAEFIYHLAEVFKKETISWSYVQRLPEKIGSFKGNVKLNILKETLPEIHPVDLADILEELPEEQRIAIFNELETEHASDTLEEIEPRVQRAIISSLTKERNAELVGDMTPAQAADVLGILPTPDAEEILDLMNPTDAEQIGTILEKRDHTISDLATSHYICLTPEMPAAVVIADFRRLATDVHVVDYLYVAGPDNRLMGVVSLAELLMAEPRTPLSDIMSTQVISLDTGDSISDAEEKFTRYAFSALPVINADDILCGVVPFRDIMNLEHKFA